MVRAYTDKRLSAQARIMVGVMSDSNLTRWTVSVSKETDIALRCFLAERGMKKGDISKFIEEAVKWRVFEQTLADARSRFADIPPDELEILVDEVSSVVRRQKTGEFLRNNT